MENFHLFFTALIMIEISGNNSIFEILPQLDLFIFSLKVSNGVFEVIRNVKILRFERDTGES